MYYLRANQCYTRMENNERQLPFGVNDFEEIRKRGLSYVDKTEYLANLRCYGPSIVTLCRPPSFGKTLFATTLKAYYEGKKELFKGLYIEKVEEEIAEARNYKPWGAYPVLWFDLGGRTYTSQEDLDEELRKQVSVWEKRYNFVPYTSSTSPSSHLSQLVAYLHKEIGEQAVLLVDNYDTPIFQTYDNPELNLDVNKSLCVFFEVTKCNNADIEACILFGRSRIRERSAFSGFNNHSDISFHYQHTKICGFTEQDLIEHFSPELAALAKKENLSEQKLLAKLEQRYGGFNFNGEDTFYNPGQIIEVLATQTLIEPWVDRDVIRSVAQRVRTKGWVASEIENLQCERTYLTNSVPEYAGVLDRLFQIGVLTVKSEEKKFQILQLGFSNEEYAYAFLHEFFLAYCPTLQEKPEAIVERIFKALAAKELENAMAQLREFMTHIDYNGAPKDETYASYKNSFFQAGLYFIFRRMNEYVSTKVECHKECVDILVKTSKQYYAFSFLCTSTAGTQESAIEALKERDYVKTLNKYKTPLRLVGVDFDAQNKNIGAWKEEEMKKDKEEDNKEA